MPWMLSPSATPTIYFCGIQEVAAARPRDAIATMSMASRGLCAAIQHAVRLGAAFVLISGSEVYGSPAEGETPQKEAYRGYLDPGGEKSWLGQAMRFAETLTVSASSEYDLSVRIIRVFNAYGEETSEASVELLPRLVRNILYGECLDAADDPEVGSFCHVTDVVEGVIRASRCDYRLPINIGTPVFVPREELVEQICCIAKCEIPLDLVLPGHPPTSKLVPDVSLARELLDWTPRVDLRAGLEGLVSHLRRHCRRRAP